MKGHSPSSATNRSPVAFGAVPQRSLAGGGGGAATGAGGGGGGTYTGRACALHAITDADRSTRAGARLVIVRSLSTRQTRMPGAGYRSHSSATSRATRARRVSSVGAL